jgi:hypothetical protein
MEVVGANARFIEEQQKIDRFFRRVMFCNISNISCDLVESLPPFCVRCIGCPE